MRTVQSHTVLHIVTVLQLIQGLGYSVTERETERGKLPVTCVIYCTLAPQLQSVTVSTIEASVLHSDCTVVFQNDILETKA